ncbi:lactate racemase domain-containing protein [Caproiciproducens sp. CPB-2]|uniref:lactate racemase domain-containing protein n=1 Tax=Caproiciproducens sp. CPB-2 TaxID=3030017 RepID=UPI0023DA553A|nr:lactate racemase domain-containing protein [Caproiciproducens sp. CPB-2]MDF1494675.1 lactate racemase domain-containing protein [Caproiciproducens sp. CPB-2]
MYIDFPPADVLVRGMDQIRIPSMVTVEQKYDPANIRDISSHIRRQMEDNLKNKGQYWNKRLCLTVGSRGIPHLDRIVRTVCDILKEWGAKPFIIPAMGSHGGATADGQKEVLAGYNITEDSMGVPVLSSMDVVEYARLDDGTKLYCDKYASESDGIILLNKVKPHTDFRGAHESGLAKMIAIGLAKHIGASSFHRVGLDRFAGLIPKAAGKFLKLMPVAFGIGIVQNAYDELCAIEVMEKEKIMEKDRELLVLAKEKIAKFKFDELDVLIIDEIGKNISGMGFDPNIVGRNNSGTRDFSKILRLQKLFIRGLSEESHHNGAGIASADVTTRQCLRSVDWGTTWTNMITATTLNGGRIPLYMNNDRQAILLAIRTCNGIDFEDVTLARIKNTLSMNEIEISQSLYNKIKDRKDIHLIRGPHEMRFDEHDNLI